MQALKFQVIRIKFVYNKDLALDTYKSNKLFGKKMSCYISEEK